MQNLPSFQEDHISQIPALQMLCKLGYQYLSPEEALAMRGGKKGNVILEQILESQLRNMEINKLSFRGQKYDFSNSNITEAINFLKNIPFDGLVRTNEVIYDLLSLGKSLEETIQDNKRSFDLNYIDWHNFDNNVFHVTEEFEVERQDGRSHRRPDIVLFVNGIPFAVIECKAPHLKDPLEQAISQQIRNQRSDEIVKLFIHSQLLISTCTTDVRYATAGTPFKFWSKWKERESFENEIKRLVNLALPSDTKTKLFKDRFKYVLNYFDDLEKNSRQVTEQDRVLYYLSRPERLLEIARNFIVFDGPDKKVARPQQYFAVKKTVARVKQYDQNRKRKGGVIWHTQGSGKSITMVMLAKALALEPSISNPRVIVVTDRKDLDRQIRDTFKHCGMEPKRARSGKELLELLESEKNTVITSVLFKFRSAVNRNKDGINTENIFVLVDESHRSQYGTAHAVMQKMLTGACYIAFTGTPLMKKEKKNTYHKFGDLIDPYTIEEATKDKVVVPLLYEGRHNILKVNREPIDKWFNVVSEPLTEYQTADLKRKFTKKRRILSAEDNIRSIAYDVSTHFRDNWQGTGFKGQIAVQSREDAIKYKKYFDEFGIVSTAIVISSPDAREGYDDVYDDEPTEEVQKFWQKMMNKYGDEDSYNEQIINDFKHSDKPEILIVVYKLLTGFDAPRNVVLYLAKELREHTLLQAIARVNRVCEGKDFGYIIDYAGILEELDKALTEYSELKGFDEADLEGALISIAEEIAKLPQKHSELVSIFQNIKNKKDAEEYEQFLYDESIRERFYEKLGQYSRCLAVALSSNKFHEDYTEYQINKYKEDLKFYQKLRMSVKRRYAEVVDFNEYEKKVKKLLDTYVTSEEIIQITEQVNIFDKAKFQEEVEKVANTASRADMIAFRTKKTIDEKFNEDPVFYEKFANLLQKAIDDFRLQRIIDAQYLDIVKDIMTKVAEHRDDDVPESIKDRDVAKAFYGITFRVIQKIIEDEQSAKNLSAKIAVGMDDIILKNVIVDWQLKDNVHNKILNELEDYLTDSVELKLNYDDIDVIMEEVLKIAKIRYAQ